MGVSHLSAPLLYGEYKCQFKCTSKSACASFVTWYGKSTTVISPNSPFPLLGYILTTGAGNYGTTEKEFLTCYGYDAL